MSDPAIGLYIHVPFCTIKCAYCDFNSYSGIEDLQSAWEDAAVHELGLWSGRLSGRELSTIFLGGGTPSLLEGCAVARVLETVRNEYRLAGDAEITLEANPESVQPQRLADYREAGVNRISMGVQSLDGGELVFLDRLHSAERARAAFGEVRAAGFENVNLDLIYGLPGQTFETWRNTLEGVLTWGPDERGPDHLSCYALTVEEGTPLAARVMSGAVVEADPDRVAEFADWTAERLARAGFRQYEISNYSRNNLACRHNLIYWRNQEYLAIGPGAHGFVDSVRYSVVRSPRMYIQRLKEGGTGLLGLPSPAIAEAEPVSEFDSVIDTLTSGLRLDEGVDESALERAYPAAYAVVADTLNWANQAGLAIRDEGRIRLTAHGQAVSNEVFVRLFDPSLL